MRRGRHLRPPGSRQAGLPGALRPAAPRAGERRHLHQPTAARSHCHKSMGHVADIFTSPVLATLPGELAIGHTRYSTAGDTVLLNAQPFSVACNKGRVAVAHNGNITNAARAARATWSGAAPSSRPPATPKSSCTWWRTLASAPWRARCAMRCCNWKARSRWCSWPRTASSWRAIRTASGRWPWARWNSPAAASATSSLRKPAPST